jgi:RHH-type transcriptional regulator, rel operon repressor / antitoxin RelB
MLAIRLDHTTENRINHLAKMTGRSKSYYVREAIQKYLDEQEDVYIALYRLEHPEATISLEEIKREL